MVTLRKKAKFAVRARRMMGQARQYFEMAGVGMPDVRVSHSTDVAFPWDMHVERSGARLDVLFDLNSYGHAPYEMNHRTTAYWHWFQQAPGVGRIICNISDGEKNGLARFAYSTCRKDVVPLPDFYFFRDRGYADSDELAKTSPAWKDRSDDIIWRGAPNNVGLFSTDPDLAYTPGVMQRLRMAMVCQTMDDVDFRFVPDSSMHSSFELQARGLIGPRVEQETWAGRKFAIDIDGFSNAWDNFLRRLKMGCCMLKVDSPFGFRQWYYDQLVPFEHYVPIRADLTDLRAQVDWVRSNPHAAEEIAKNGQDVARRLTFESETLRAGQLIEQNA